MTGPIHDMHDSADSTTESNFQLRLVMASEARNMRDGTNTGASLSSPKIEHDQTDLHESSSLPTHPDENDDDGRVASEDEVRELLHVVDKIPARLWIACIAGILERFVWYGATAPLRAWYPHPLYNSSLADHLQRTTSKIHQVVGFREYWDFIKPLHLTSSMH